MKRRDREIENFKGKCREGDENTRLSLTWSVSVAVKTFGFFLLGVVEIVVVSILCGFRGLERWLLDSLVVLVLVLWD